jgi:hypothetical protein
MQISQYEIGNMYVLMYGIIKLHDMRIGKKKDIEI